MQEIASVILFVGVLIFLAHLFTSIFSRTRIPDVILLIAIGICIGPVLGLTSPLNFGQVGPVFTTITLIVILFEGGIALKLGILRVTLAGAMKLAPINFFLTMAVTAGFALWLTDLELLPAFILGAIVGSTSETVVIPLINQLRIREETRTLLSVESSVNDVLSIVITVTLIEAYQLGEFSIVSISGDLIAAFLVAIVFGVVGAFIWSILLNRIRAIKNAMFTTPAFVFVIFGITETMGFSGAIAALAFGVTIGNIESISFPIFKPSPPNEPVGLSETEKVFFGEVAFLLKTFFFVYLGISLELISGWLITVGLILAVVAFALRIPAVRLSISKSVPKKDASIISVMVPKGLAAVVLASIPLQLEIAGGELIQSITYSVVLSSIVITSFLVLLLDRTKLPGLYSWLIWPTFGFFRSRARADSQRLSDETVEITPAGTRLFGGRDRTGRTE
ncbi:MAG: cation:proton antiporter [Dehalococcoidales bacterium]|nr:MAG: cation:proton antiporter [Dehalococcoidales bacterium]